MMSNGYKLTRYSASPRETLLDRPKRVAREVDMPLIRHDDVILDPNAAELAEIVHLRPVHVLRVLALAQIGQQRLDEVEAGLDGENHARVDDARQAQVGVPLRFGDDAAGAISVEAGHVVDLQAEEVADAVGEEGGTEIG